MDGTTTDRAPFELSGTRVWVAGHTGLVGSALVRRLADEPIAELITARRTQVDLTRQTATEQFVARAQPDVALVAAARVGGIGAHSTRQGQFLYENLMIAANVVEACRHAGVRKVVLLGTSAVYPRTAPQPMREEHLLTGPLGDAEEGYAVAKIAGHELGKLYRRQYGMDAISLFPTNLYGPGDDFDLDGGHVLPSLLRRIDEAHRTGADHVTLWGTGTPRREFLHVDDLADATLFALRHHSGEEPLNVGTGTDVTIAELARTIADVVGWDGELRFDTDKPDGAPRKLLDVSRLAELGWSASIGLREGIEDTYRWFVEHRETARGMR